DQERSHAFASEQPSQCNLRGRGVMRLADFTQLVDYSVALVAIVGQHVEAGEASTVALGVVPGVLAGEESAGERTPDQDSDARVLDKRDDLVFQVAAHERVVHLGGAESSPSVLVLQADGGGRGPR